ncbi:MAG: HK97 gp10 family phage protein [Dorea sp.]|nr:HK97 gp10 family phage protein [Dorea sp.]
MAGSNVKVSADGLADALNKALQETKELTDEAVQTSVDKTAKEVVAKTKGAAPARTGKYKRGWKSKVTGRTGRGAYGRTVHNGPRYMLTHLLQNGHEGPRPARAIPHIPSDEETEAIFIKNLESEMAKG